MMFDYKVFCGGGVSASYTYNAVGCPTLVNYGNGVKQSYVAGHDENGKPIRKNVLGKTQAEVREKLHRAIEESKRLDVNRTDEYTVGKWVETWYEICSRPHIRESTQKYYRRFIEHHIVPMLGDKKLTKLTSRDIQRMYNEALEHGRVRDRQKLKKPGMSALYVRGLHAMFHNCLERAVKERLLLRNPSDDCIPPKLQRKEIMFCGFNKGMKINTLK